jgi:hypothetical protein
MIHTVIAPVNAIRQYLRVIYHIFFFSIFAVLGASSKMHWTKVRYDPDVFANYHVS